MLLSFWKPKPYTLGLPRLCAQVLLLRSKLGRQRAAEVV
jgi:hypothetical protein